jgi:protein-S-isoprenylcysteine O-methyltransferase Ste14
MLAGLWWVLFLGFVCIRLWVLSGMLAVGGIFALALGAVEFLALLWGVVNAVTASHREYSLLGLWPPVAYALGLFVLPVDRAIPSFFSALCTLSGLLLTSWALLCLRTRFSVGPTCWVGLCDWGPYRLIRHPQLAARMLLCVGVLLGVRSVPDALACGAALILTATVILAEEAALSRLPEWVGYRSRVRHALVPGVL